MAAQDDRYDVVSPLGKIRESGRKRLGEPVADLNGKTVGELWDYIGRGDEVFPLVREELTKRFPGIKIVPYTDMGNTHGPKEREVVAAIPDKLREHGIDLVVSGLGV